MEMEEDAERPTAVEALGTEKITPDGEASMRAEVDAISRRCREELAVAAPSWRGRTELGDGILL
jgi:hypothetical protein